MLNIINFITATRNYYSWQIITDFKHSRVGMFNIYKQHFFQDLSMSSNIFCVYVVFTDKNPQIFLHKICILLNYSQKINIYII